MSLPQPDTCKSGEIGFQKHGKGVSLRLRWTGCMDQTLTLVLGGLESEIVRASSRSKN